MDLRNNVCHRHSTLKQPLDYKEHQTISDSEKLSTTVVQCWFVLCCSKTASSYRAGKPGLMLCFDCTAN